MIRHLHAVCLRARRAKLATQPAMAQISAMSEITIPQARSAPRDSIAAEILFFPADGSPPVEWRISDGLTDYETAVAEMEARAAAIRDGTAPELVWLVEHPALYTAGTSADPQDLVAPDRFPVFQTGRGGEYTYHGPGQRVAYVMLDLKRRREDVRAFVAALEEWIIRTLDRFNVKGERREDRVGVWVVRPEKPSTVPGQPPRTR
jgi:lipoyl(octanoyl) transferase